MNEAIKYYQKVKQNYKMDGKSFENYKDVFDFAEDYHKAQTLKEHSDKLTLLKNYSEFLEKNGYLDTDWRYEKPYAINEYLKATK